MAASLYETTFPAVPRFHGLAKVAYGSGPSQVTFVTKDTFAETLGVSGAAAADAEKEAVGVKYVGEERHFVAGLGKKGTVESLRKAVIAAVGKARALKLDALTIVAPTIPGLTGVKVAETIVQAGVLSNYAFDRYCTQEGKVAHLISAISFDFEAAYPGDAAVLAAAKTTEVMAQCCIFARDLANNRPDEAHPQKLQEVAAVIAAEMGAEMNVIKGDALLEKGLHMLYAVGQAATRETHLPRYIEVVYKGDPDHPEDVIAMVGKGVCFDTGGLNLKGTGFIENMHLDKCGAVAVLGTALAAQRLGVKRNVVFVVGAVDNAIDSLSYKPHAIMRSHKGLTVENGNCDAEGRLVLADALSYVQQTYKPHTVIDTATLTGACVIALGEYTAGLFTNNKAICAALVAAGAQRFERAWPMPILPEHRDELTSGTQYADLKSTGAGRYGGACTAAAFLENFIGTEPAGNARTGVAAGTATKPAWAHVDIASVAMASAARGFSPKDGTGFGVQLLTQYLLDAPAGALPADADE